MGNKLLLAGKPPFKTGKVRELFEIPEGIIFVATDRVSAFDVVFPDLIPDKGRFLNLISAFWFNHLRDVVDNHFITADPEAFPPAVRDEILLLEGRAMLVKRAEILPVECIVRGYLSGSAWAEYRKSGTVCGRALPGGLKQSAKLAAPLFTPTTKADSGHDRPLLPGELEQLVGEKTAAELEKLSIAIYQAGAEHVRKSGLILADTKFEFGMIDGKLCLADEVLTPDSSRFWLAADYREDCTPTGFDKQYLRDYVESISWDKNPPAPKLPDEVIQATRQRYLQAYHMITGHEELPVSRR